MQDALSPEAHRHRAALARLISRAPRRPGDNNRWTGLTDVQNEAVASVDNRVGSLIWHVRLLGSKHRHIVDSANRDLEAILTVHSDPMLGVYGHIELSHLLDDVVFNAVALMDHTCVLLAHLFGDDFARCTWRNTVTKRIKKGRSPLPEAVALPLTVSFDEWGDGLDDFRNAHIHRELHAGKATQGLHPEKPRIEYRFYLPTPLAQDLATILPAPDDEGVELVTGANVIGVRCLRLSAELIALAADSLASGATKPTPVK